MPGFNRMGPQGQGPMTGKGMGHCGRGLRFGSRRGCGRGLGRYFGWNPPETKDEKIADMEAYKKALKEEMEDLEKELTEVKKLE